MKSKHVHVRCETCGEDHIDTKNTWPRKHSGHKKARCECDNPICVDKRAKNPITNENSFFIAYKNAIIIIGGNLIEALEDWKLIKVKEPAKKRSISCKFKV